jgi:hypothetical protein
MRRFDGHGSSSYRPTNPEAAKEMKSAMSRMLMERERQDKGLFTGQREGLFGQKDSQIEIRTTELKVPEKTTIIKLYKPEKTEKTETKDTSQSTEQFYSLSD